MLTCTDPFKEGARAASQAGESSSKKLWSSISKEVVASTDSSPLSHATSSSFQVNHMGESSLSIAVIGATGELAKRKIFPALFALYYSGFLPHVSLLSVHLTSVLLDFYFVNFKFSSYALL